MQRTPSSNATEMTIRSFTHLVQKVPGYMYFTSSYLSLCTFVLLLNKLNSKSLKINWVKFFAAGFGSKISNTSRLIVRDVTYFMLLGQMLEENLHNHRYGKAINAFFRWRLKRSPCLILSFRSVKHLLQWCLLRHFAFDLHSTVSDAAFAVSRLTPGFTEPS